MALTKEEQSLIKRIYQQLDDAPLQPADPLYQSIYGNFCSEDPVELMQTHIEWNDIDSLQMFSGFRGSGKTTELFRLKKNLEDQGYVVLYSDALNYINPSEEIAISDLLLVLAGAFSDALEEDLNINLAGESYWTRLVNYLSNTNVSLSEASVKAELDSPAKDILGGAKTGGEFKLAFRTTPSFRQKLQQFLTNRIGELKETVDSFIKEGVEEIRRQHGDTTKVVFIIDSLEQIRGSLSNEQSVIRSVERLFANHLAMLKLPMVHAVYTVPPWLQFVMPNFVDIAILPSICQWNNDEDRSEYPSGWEALRSLVVKRFGPEGFKKFFGDGEREGHHTLADDLIRVCGGHFRDLLRLLREAVIRTRTGSLPVSKEIIEAAITSVRNDFLPIAIDDARWLYKIGQLRKTVLPSTKPEDVNRLTRFLDTHFVLYFKSGIPWYDIHPLIRDELAELIKLHGESNDER